MSMTILIDLTTLRENPNAGEISKIVAGRVMKEMIVQMDRSPQKEEMDRLFQADPSVWWSSSFETAVICDISGYLKPELNDEQAREIANDIGVLSSRIEVRQECSRVHHMPEPKWLFDYEDTEITCNNCGDRFPHQQLQNDTIPDG